MLPNNLPDRWDMEADVVSIGSGIGGLSAAITAHDHGLEAVVLERSGQVRIGLVDLPLEKQIETEVVMRHRCIGVETDRFCVLGVRRAQIVLS